MCLCININKCNSGCGASNPVAIEISKIDIEACTSGRCCELVTLRSLLSPQVHDEVMRNQNHIRTNKMLCELEYKIFCRKEWRNFCVWRQ